jgi:diacylglycerol kinase family enzyme
LQNCFRLEAAAPSAVSSTAVPVILNCKAGGGRSQAEVERLQAAFAGTGLEPRVAQLEEGCDVGEVNGRCFINNARLGLYPGMVQERERQQSRLRRSKRHAMLWATLAVLQRPPLLDVRLTLDDRVQECFAPFVFVGNNHYELEGFDIGTRARLDAGLLDVYTTCNCSTGGLILLALRAMFGALRQADDFVEAPARSLRIASRRSRLLVATDGEVTSMRTPLEFRIQPRALEVLVP